jgi:hypothetical protein
MSEPWTTVVPLLFSSASPSPSRLSCAPFIFALAVPSVSNSVPALILVSVPLSILMLLIGLDRDFAGVQIKFPACADSNVLGRLNGNFFGFDFEKSILDMQPDEPVVFEREFQESVRLVPVADLDFGISVLVHEYNHIARAGRYDLEIIVF